MQTLFAALLVLFVFMPNVYSQTTDLEKWRSNFDQGQEKLNSADYQGAVPFFSTAYELAKTIYSVDSEERIETLFFTGYNYFKLRSFSKAIPVYEEVYADLNKLNALDNQYYYHVLDHLSTMYRDIGSYSKSEQYYKLRLEFVSNSKGETHGDYSMTLIGLSTIYRLAGQFEKAIDQNKRALEIIEQQSGIESASYALGLTSLSQIYGELGDYDLAITQQKRAVEIFGEEDKTSRNNLVGILTLASLYDRIGAYEKTVEVCHGIRSVLNEDHGAYVAANNILGQAYDKLGDYEKALSYTLESLEKTPIESYSYANRMQNLAFIYVRIGDFTKAEQSYPKALQAMEQTIGRAHPDYGKLLNNVGKLYYQMDDLDKAQDYFDRALSNFIENFDENHQEYGYYLNDYAKVLLAQGNIEEATALMEKNLAIAEQNERTTDQAYFNRQYSLARAYIKGARFKDALTLLETATINMKEFLGAEHPSYGNMLQTLGECLVGLNRIHDAVSVLEKSNEIMINQLDKIFKFRSEAEKKVYLTIVQRNFDYLQSIALNQTKKNAGLTAMNLNNQLMLKGLLLNNSKNILIKLNTLDDPEIDEKIIAYRSNRSKLTNLLSSGTQPEADLIEALKEEINDQEAALVKLYSTHFSDDVNMVKDWNAARNTLKPDEVAIEFSRFNYVDKKQASDSIVYVAYLYKSDMITPEMIPLFSERELMHALDKQTPNSIYKTRGSIGVATKTGQDVYDLIWEPLSDKLENSRTIYFAPSGLLFQISFAALGKTDDQILIQKFDMNQLSSTYKLINTSTDTEFHNAYLIGGVNYDAATNEGLLTAASTTIVQHQSLLESSKGTRSLSENWDYLPGTLTEITEIEKLLDSKNISTTTLSASNASEERFKSLHGSSPDILHIATHGFFFEASERSSSPKDKLGSENQYQLANDPLLRSGIILAGANKNWNNRTERSGEDGILTAMEISNLDLSNTKMVILSACETGLGDIDGSEGVYGLQRAFKMAGVDIMVMSLWQVPDNETAEFMNLFYENWIQTNNVKKAFNDTQRTMHKKYKNEPYKWAAFVLFE